MTRSKALASTCSKLLRTTPLAGGGLAAICLLAAPVQAQPVTNALPSLGSVAAQSGSNTITGTQTGPSTSPTLTIGLGDNQQSIINWNSFDIGQNANVNFTVTFGGQGAVLNRVVGANFSQIYGDLTGPSNLNVFLINPNGIVYGPTAAVNVGGLVSSTLDLADADFMNGPAYNFTGTATTGVSVLSGAQLVATNGPLVLLGGFVSTAGTLNSGRDVVMAAGSDITLAFAAGSPLSMTINQGTPLGGTLVEVGGAVSGANVYAAVASRTGVLDALLNVSGTVTATTATASDRGIVLAAGTSGSGVTVASGGGNDTAGPARINIAGMLTAADTDEADVANLEIRSRGNVTGAGAINSGDLVDITSATGNVTLTGGDAIDAGDGITVTAAATVSVANAETINGSLALTGAAVDLANSRLAAANGNIAIIADGLINGNAGSQLVARNISLTADDWTGGILGAAALQETQDVSITDTAGGLTISAATGVSAQRHLSISTIGGNLTVGGVTAGVQASGVGNMSLTASGSIQLDGTIAAAGDTLSLSAGQSILQNVGSIAAGTLTGNAGTTVGLFSASNQVDTLGTFTADMFRLSDTGGLTVSGAVNARTAELGLRTTGDLLVNGALTAGTYVVLHNDGGSSLALNAPVTATNIVELISLGTGASVTQTAPITTSTLFVTSGGAANLSNPANQIGILGFGSATSLNLTDRSGGLVIDGNVSSGSGPIAIRTSGPLTVRGDLTGSDITLSTDGAFINNSGSNAITASNRWLVYSADPSANSFGGLNSNRTAIWNATYGSVDPATITGNRYIFAYQPTLTVTTLDTSKVYGTDLTSATAGLYTITGFHAGIAGAFLGDTAVTALSGAPTISSAGMAADASVGGGPYAVTASDGTLASTSGYAIAFNNAGAVTVTPKELNAAVAANDKTYDGTTNATGSISLNGVLSGDDVTASALFAFADKNAGSGKTVTITGGSLLGADAGNYRLTLPASVLADIFQKALTGTVIANDKIYDGTTAATGTISLDGVVAGDDVTASAILAFLDKNAGADKIVTVSGGSLSGSGSGNYTLTLPASALADIFRKAISGTVVVNDKTYDGTTSASGSVSLNGIIAGDSVTGSATFAFADKNAGAGKTVNVSGEALSGADAGNYTLTLPATVLADILQKALTGTVSVDSKTYDGTTGANGSVSLDGVIAGDNVAATASYAFADKNAGAAKAVNVTGAMLSGADAGNYTIILPATALADILKKTLTGAITVQDKTYDGTNAAVGSITLNGVVAGDAVSGTATFHFSDQNAGTDKTVNISGGALSGADAGNYTLALPATALADILQRALVIVADDQSKAQGTADPTLTYTLTDGSLVGSDSLSGNLIREVGEAPGNYSINQGTLAASSNYVITFRSGVMTIEPSRQTVQTLRATPLPAQIHELENPQSPLSVQPGIFCDPREPCPTK